MGKIFGAGIVFAAVMAVVFVVMAVVGLVFAFPVKWLWNMALPDLLGVNSIGYWQAWAVFLLCSLLFKSAGSGKSN